MITRTINIGLAVHSQDLNKVIVLISEDEKPPIKHVFDRSMLYDRVIEPTSNVLRRVVNELLTQINEGLASQRRQP